MRIILLLIILSLGFNIAFAKNEDKKIIKKGNESYNGKKYIDAEMKYRKALEKNNKSKEAAFNLGDALYKQKKYGEAADKFLDMTAKDLDAKTKASSYYNYGNSLLQENKFAESIEAYKNALRHNPKDYDAKYNLEYARQMLAQQQNQQNKNGDNNKQNQDQNQQKQNEQKNKDQQDKKNQEQNGQQQNQEQKQDQNKEGQQSQPQQQKMNKQDAERMLQALANNEKDIQKKLLQKQKTKRLKIQKNW